MRSPGAVEYERVLTSLALRKALREQSFDIVHISAFVLPRSGDLYFSDVNPRTGESASVPEVDFISADDVRGLCKNATARLVVIGSCDSLALATTLVRDTNVIAARDAIRADLQG